MRLPPAFLHPAPLSLNLPCCARRSKWAISWNNLKDLNKPLEKVSAAQMTALTVTGLIWTRYSFVITPINYNMAVVQSVCAASSGYHLSRKLNAEYGGTK